MKRFYKFFLHVCSLDPSNRVSLLFAVLLMSGLLSVPVVAQVSNTESFDGATFVPVGWTDLLTSGTATWTRVTSGSWPVQSPHTGSGEAQFNSFSASTGVRSLITPVINLTGRGATATSITFWMYRDGGYLASADKIDVFYNTAASLTGATALGTVNRSMNLTPTVAAIGWYQYTFSVPASFTGTTNYLILQATSAYGDDIYLDDVAWQSFPLPCSGTPTPGNTVASNNPVCAGSAFSVSLQNLVSGSGVTYQWQSSPTGVTYTNIGGATAASYSSTTTTTIYYRCSVTCTGSGLSAFSTPLAVNVSFLVCYCLSNASTPYDEEILNVTLGTLNNSSTCGTTGGPGSILNQYSNYTGVTPPNLALSTSYPLSVQVGTCGGTYSSGVRVFIDFNQNGLFTDAGEDVFTTPTSTSGPYIATGSVLVPANAGIGLTRMRVVNVETGTPSSITACGAGSYGYGETEDYYVNILCPFTTLPMADFTTADTIFVGSPTVIYNNNTSLALRNTWYVDGVVVGTGMNLPYTFSSTAAPYIVKLVSSSCFGVDSMTKSILVYNPTQKPICDFISNLNTVEIYQSVQLTDLSTKAPSYWNWTFTPNAGVNYNSGTSNLSQNPTVSFTIPGVYQVCMWDSNILGRSATVCKTAYILVKATNQMCIFPFDTKVSSGTLYDDGGPTANYSTGGLCNFLIDPCASSISLNFSAFNLSANTYFKVYNGNSNLAPPLHTGLGFTGTVIPGTLTASSGKMYIEFVRGGVAAPGFAASWTSTAASTPAPNGTVLGPDTVYDCGAFFTKTYQPTSLTFNKSEAYYTWYFDYTNSPFPDIEGKGLYTQDWSYSSVGSYVVRLDIEGCGGIETIYKTVFVDHPATGPVIDFKMSLQTATPTDVVLFSDLSSLDPIWWQWTLTGPGTITSSIGNVNSKNYGVKFGAPGLYTVTLKDSNCIASSTLTKTIMIIEYCVPAVGTLNADFAIERFKLGRADTIINNTVYGLDYTNTTPAIGTVAYRDNTNKVKTYIVNGVTLSNKAVEAVIGLGESFNFDVKRFSNFNAANTKIWVDWNQDGTFQSSEMEASSGVSTAMNFTGSISIPLTAQLGRTRLRIGVSFAGTSNTPCGVNTFGDYNDYRIDITPDVTAPNIVIVGNVDSVFVEVGRVFSDPGTTVTGATTIAHTGFAYGATVTTYPFLGTHTITASDAALNTSVRNVYVRATPDITLPVLTMKGSSPYYVEVKSAYTDSGATATDFYFGSLTASIVTTSTVNVNKVGTYSVVYNVNDAAGNAAATITRTVIVRDTQKPVITLNTTDTIYLSVFSVFTSPVVTVTDNYNTGLIATVSGGPVNTNIVGTYVLFYNATDSSGNIAVTKKFTVIVRDTKAPTLFLVLADTMLVDVNTLTVVPEPGVVYYDNYYATGLLTLTVNYSNVKLNILGDYAVRYYISDPSGNTDSSHVRVYRVVDRKAPVITIKGGDYIVWPRWKTYVDAGDTVTDNYYTGLVCTPDISKVNVYLPGVYEVTFTLTDPSGNKAEPRKRQVEITVDANGITSQGKDDLFIIYPNPSQGLVNVELNRAETNQANITIYDAQGKVLYATTTSSNHAKMSIDLSKEAAGMYFIKAVSETLSISKTFIIQ